MDTKFKKTILIRTMYIMVVLAMILSVSTPAHAVTTSPFVGKWEAVDVDGSDIRLSIGGPPSGPFQITWTESNDDNGLGFCEGGPGLVRGTGSLNEDDPFALEADLWVECFTIEKSMEFHLTFRYIASTDTLVTTYPGGMMVVFTHPRSPQASPAQVRLMTNYQEDWASGFYEEGHTVWLVVTENDGISVKATAEMITGPQPGWDGGEIGFASQPWEWQPEQPDIVPNDWVYVWVDNGASTQMQVGEINAWVDLENDQVLGTVSASWYDQEVYIYCFLWGVTDARDDMIMADGSEGFTCSWSGGAYDIRPGDVAEIQYYGPDGHAVDYYLFLPNPHFTVFPEWEWFDGYDWPDGVTVTIKVQDKPECATEGVSSGNFFNGGFPEGCDIAIDDVITFTDGETLRTHTVRNLAITEVDKEGNTIAGTADVGDLVYAWVHEYGYDMELQVEDGTWFADFGSAGLDLVENMGGRAEIRDEFGNGTAVDWWIPNPRFTVFPEWEWFDGYDWPDGAIVTITVNGKPECETTGESWGYFFNGGFPEGCDIAVGDFVTFTDGETTRTHTVRNLAVTAVDEAADTVSGTSDPYETVYVWQHEPGEQIPVEADEYGAWLADLNGYYDIHPGSNGRSEIRDEAGNGTAVDWYVLNPRFSVFPAWEYIEGWEWPDGATVYATIEEKPDCFAEGMVGYSGDPITFVQMWFPAGCDAVIGDVVTMTDNETTRQYTIQNLAVNGVDAANDTVSGTADAGAQVHVWPHGYNELLPTADTDGYWTADFSETGPDLVEGMAGRTEVRDEMGNATAVEWWVPMMIFVTSTSDVVANDGVCTLREAVIAANTNAPSGDLDGECPAGLDNQTDSILLAANQTYSLTIDSTFEDGALDGDLDIWDNSTAIDLIVIVEGNGASIISQDALVDDRVLEIHGATLQIEGLTLTGGSNVEIGGGVHNAGGTLIMNASIVSGNMANYGGGVYNGTSGTLILTGSTVSGNTANVDGGGLENGGTLTVDASRISANLATYNGGGFFTYQGTVTIQNGSIIGGDLNAGEGNVANLGGGMTVWSGNVTIDSSTVSGNAVSWDGGGVRIMNAGTLTVNNSTIFGNSAANAGGGLHNHGALTVSTSEVTDNTASNGGGIGNDGGILTLTNSTVSGNSANWDGGGVLNWLIGMVTISASGISGNSADHVGGGLLNYGTWTMDSSTLSDNMAGEAGGGLFNLGTLTMTGGALLGNTADGQGDAVYSATDTVSATTVTNSCIVGNGGTAVFNERSASQNFIGNWWGDASGPSGLGPGTGDSVSDYVDFFGWLLEPPAICAP